MKTSLLTLLGVLLFIPLGLNAQRESNYNYMFVRVYNLEGKKINKGNVLVVTDTTLVIKGKRGYENIPVNSIGLIKTKHSEGHNVLMGAVVGGSTIAILGVATADPDAWIFGYSAGEGAAVGGVLGGTAGAAIGGITILFKNSKSFIINGDLSKWKAFQEGITRIN